jgi:hypothetical protein
LIFSQKSEKYLEKYNKGFIINNNGDSIEGYIKGFIINELSSIILYKTLPREGYEEHRYTPAEISSFGDRSGNFRYTSAYLPLKNTMDSLFVMEIIEGDYDLLGYWRNNEKHLLIRNRQNNVTDVTFKTENNPGGLSNSKLSEEEFRSLISYIFSDEPKIMSRLSETKPTKRSLINLLSDYHKEKNISYRKYGAKNLVFEAGLTAGMTRDKYNVYPDGQTAFIKTTTSPYAGLVLSLGFENKIFSLFTESTISDKSFQYSFSQHYSSGNGDHEIKINTLFLNNEYGLRIGENRKKKISFCLSTGGVASYFVSPDYDNYSKIFDNQGNLVLSEYYDVKMNSHSYHGMFFRPGVNYLIRSKSVIRLTCEYSVLRGTGGEKLRLAGASLIFQFRLK